MFAGSGLGKFFAVISLVAKFFGLCPYAIDKTTNGLSYHYIRTIYSIIFFIVVLFSYCSFGPGTLNSSEQTVQIPSDTMEVLIQLLVYVMIVTFIQLYVGIHFKFGAIKWAYQNCLKVVPLLESFKLDRSEVKRFFVTFFLKSVGYEILDFFVLCFNLSRYSNILSIYPFIPLIMNAPRIIIKFYHNIFYGGVSILHIGFKLVNRELQTKIASQRTSELYGKCNAETYSRLSDELDKLLTWHGELSEATKAFNLVFDVQLFLWIIMQLFWLLVRYFYQYVEVMQLLSTRESYKQFILPNIFYISSAILTWTEILLTSSVCESIANEVCSTGVTLYAFSISKRNYDVN